MADITYTRTREKMSCLVNINGQTCGALAMYLRDTDTSLGLPVCGGCMAYERDHIAPMIGRTVKVKEADHD